MSLIFYVYYLYLHMWISTFCLTNWYKLVIYIYNFTFFYPIQYMYK